MFNRTESHTSPTCGPVPPAPCTVQGPETLDAAFYLKARLACSVSHTRDVTCGGVWGPDAGTRLQTLPGGEPPPRTPAKVWLKRRNEQKMETLRRQGTPGSVALGLPKLWLQRGRRPPMPHALGHTPVTLKTPGLRSMHRAGGPGRSAAVTAPGAGEGTGRAGDTRRQRPPRGPVFLLLTLTPVFWKKSLKPT